MLPEFVGWWQKERWCQCSVAGIMSVGHGCRAAVRWRFEWCLCKKVLFLLPIVKGGITLLPFDTRCMVHLFPFHALSDPLLQRAPFDVPLFVVAEWC